MPQSSSESSDSEPNLSFTSMAAASSSSPLAATPDSTTSSSNTHQRRSTSAKSLHSPEVELERGFSSSSTGAAGAQTSTNNNNNTRSSSNNRPQRNESSHNDLSGRMTKSEADATTLERALAAGISRDEFEKAKAGVIDMLNGSQQNKQKSKRKGRGSAAIAELGRANEASLISPSGRDYGDSPSTSAPTSRQSNSKNNASASRSSSGNTTARLTLSTSNSTSSLALSQAPSVFTPSDSGPSTATTFRTSVSSSQAAEDDFSGSPPTSDEEVEATTILVKGDKRRVQQQQLHANESAESNKSSDPDSSFNAATAAAAALGMLASSPVKHQTRTGATKPSASTSSASLALQQQQGGSSSLNGSSFTQHRASINANGANLASSSSPGSGGNNSAAMNLAPSPRSGSRSPNNYHRQGARASSSNATATELDYTSATSRGKSTTPVRTRLEDIALKSSAQIRRTRERLGLDESEEMMDMDTDARHQAQIMRNSMGPIDGDEQMLVSDDDGEQQEQGAHSPLTNRSTGSGLAPAFAFASTSRSPGGTSYAHYQHEDRSNINLPPASPTRSARGGQHRRMASYDMSGGSGKGRAVGMLDRFMEESSSPKAAHVARFGGPLEDHEDYTDAIPRTFKDEMAMADSDRSNRLGKRRAIEADTFQAGGLKQEDDDEPDYQSHPVQSTPKGRAHQNKVALLRSAGNDLPSPLLAQIGSLRDEAFSPAHNAEAYHMHSLPSPRHRLGEPSSDSVAGSARKRKASYDLASPRQVVRSYETSPPPLSPLRRESMSPPLQFSANSSSSYRQNAYPPSSPRFSVRQTPTHPSSRNSNALFEGPGSSRASSRSSRAPPDSQERPLNLFPYNQGLREGQLESLNLRPPPPTLEYPSRPSSAASDSLSQSQQDLSHFEPYHHEPIAPIPSSITKKRETRKKRQSTIRSAQQDQGSEQEDTPAQRQQLQRSQSQQSNILFASTGSSTATPLPEDFVFANIPIGQYDAKTKPPFSYAALIGQAIFSTPNRRMSLADIYTYIMTLYPFYKKQDAGWQNSIRHNLSLNECFVKTQRLADEPGKGCLWSISPGTEEQFTGGNFYKKGKVPKLSSSANGVNSANSSKAGSVAGGSTSARKSKKAGSVMSDAQSVVSADDSFDNMSMNSSSYMANITPQPLAASGYGVTGQHHGSNRRQEYQQQPHPSAAPPNATAYRLPRPPQPGRPRASSNLRQQSRKYYDEENDAYVDEDEGDSNSLDMEPLVEEPVQQETEVLAHPRRAITLRHQRAASGTQGYISSQPLQHQLSSPEKPTLRIKKEDISRDEDSSLEMELEQHSHLQVEDNHNYPVSERSMSAEPSQQAFDDRHPPPDLYNPIPAHRRAMLNSPPIMASPPTTVLARISQPYQPIRSAFSIPGQSNERVAALLSSPPAAGIMPSESRGSGLPPPTPRSASNQGLNNSDEDFNASRSIFLPAPNIKPGKTSLTRKAVGDDDGGFEPEKPVLPPIAMMSSPVSAPLQVATQSPISSLRASAATRRSTSPSPKAGSSHSSTNSIASLNRSPTIGKSKSSVSMDFFKTPDRFGPSASAGARTSPQKLAQIAGNNASRALQSFQQSAHSTPKLPGTRSLMGMVTPGGYYDPYEYGAVLDEELERMAGSREAEYSGHRDDSRRALPFPSPIDRTPKWQPWSPW